MIEHRVGPYGPTRFLFDAIVRISLELSLPEFH